MDIPCKENDTAQVEWQADSEWRRCGAGVSMTAAVQQFFARRKSVHRHNALLLLTCCWACLYECLIIKLLWSIIYVYRAWVDVFRSDDIQDVEQHREASCAALKNRLNDINAQKRNEVNHHLAEALKNFEANARWRFVDPHGERVPAVVANDAPLMWKWDSVLNSLIILFLKKNLLIILKLPEVE